MAITINGTANTVAGLAVGGLPDGTVDGDTLAANAVNASKIANTTITAAQIAADTITASQIAANAVGDSELSATTGKVLKMQWNISAGQSSTTNTSMTTLHSSTAFTPTAADSNLLVMVHTAIGNNVTAGTGGNANFRIASECDGTTAALCRDPWWNRYGKGAVDAGYHPDFVTGCYVYECTSTNAVTFHAQAKRQDGSSTPTIGGRVSDGSYSGGCAFVVVEVAG